MAYETTENWPSPLVQATAMLVSHKKDEPRCVCVVCHVCVCVKCQVSVNVSFNVSSNVSSNVPEHI